MSLPSSFNHSVSSHTIGKATPTAICESYDITVRCNAGKSLLLKKSFLFLKPGRCGLIPQYNPKPNPKLAQAEYPAAPFQLMQSPSTLPNTNTTFRTTEKATPTKCFVDHRLLEISDLQIR